MTTEARTIFKHGRAYLVGNILSRFAGLLLIPIYAKTLTPEEFGIYALIVVVADLIAGGLGLGIGSAIARVYFEHDDAGRRKVISSTLLAFCALGMALLILSWPIAAGMSWLLFGDNLNAAAVLFAICGIVFSTLSGIQLDFYRIEKRSGTFLLLSLVKSVLLLALNLVFVVLLGLGVAGIFLGTLLAFAGLSLVLLVVILRETGIGFSMPMLRAVLGLGMPIVPAMIFDTASRFIERYLLNMFLSTAHVGYYSLGARFTQVLAMLGIHPFNQIYGVRRFETMNDEQARVQLVQVFFYFFVLLAAAGLALSLMAPELIIIVAKPTYMSAAYVIPVLALATCLNCIWMLHYEITVIQEKRTGYVPLVSGVCLVVGAVSGVVLIWQLGIMGAAISTVLVQFVRLVLMAIIAGAVSPGQPPLPIASIVGLLCLAAAFYLFSLAMFGIEISLTIASLKIFLFFAFVATVYFTPIVGPSGRAWASALWRELRTGALPAKAGE